MLRTISSWRLMFVALVGALVLGPAAVAGAQTSPTVNFEHNSALDGTPAEIVGGAFGLIAGAGTPDQQRYALPNFLEANDTNNNFTPPPYGGRQQFSWETQEFTVAPGTQNGSFTVTVRWGNPNVDFDVFVYRKNADGSVGPNPIAQSAAGGTVPGGGDLHSAVLGRSGRSQLVQRRHRRAGDLRRLRRQLVLERERPARPRARAVRRPALRPQRLSRRGRLGRSDHVRAARSGQQAAAGDDHGVRRPRRPAAR